MSCEWIPAPYEEFGDDDYGNHDKANRPEDQSIDYIVIHDTEGSWETTLKLVQDPTYVSWQYTLRSSDGHIAQHLNLKDVGWHAGNWAINSKSVGLEHEGILTNPDAWYTEAMYRSSARLVKHLAKKYGIPLDRQHILGHDTVPGPVSSSIPGMHTDPGPYWDWQHYFTLMGKPFTRTAGPNGGLVTVAPEYAKNRSSTPAAPSPASPVRRTVERGARVHGAVRGRPAGQGHRAAARRRRLDDRRERPGLAALHGPAVCGRRAQGRLDRRLVPGPEGLVQEPEEAAHGARRGRSRHHAEGRRGDVPVYGRAYPEVEAYPAGITPQPVSPLPYKLLAGQGTR